MLGIVGVEECDVMDALTVQPEESLHIVVAFDLIEHFKKDELLEFIDKVYRCLLPGGQLIVHTPNGASPFFGTVRYGDFTHENAFTRNSIRQILLASGFLEVSCFEDTPNIHGIKSLFRWAIWKIIRGCLRLYIGAETGDLSKDHIFTQNFVTVATK